MVAQWLTTATLLAVGDIGTQIEPDDELAALIAPLLRNAEDFQPATPQHIFTVPYEEDLELLSDDIRNAKARADVVVMSIHWGVHHLPKYIAHYQPVVAHVAIDAGADLILGHHPHCLKGVEVYKGRVCFYSIGNLIAPGGHKEHSVWDLCFYHVDPNCLPPHGKYYGPRESRMTMVVKAVFDKHGVRKVSFLPAFINPQAQPAVVPAGDPKFDEILSYMEWASEKYTHEFHADGNEIVIAGSSNS